MLLPDPSPLFTGKEIQLRVNELANEIATDLNGADLVVIGLLRGCFVFTSDLVRALSEQGTAIQEVDFLVASSYGSGTESSGNVKIEKDIKIDIAGKHVLVVDDILDTGNTLQKVLQLFSSRKPAWLKTCVVLDKSERREVDIEADFSGFSIPNHFVVGYGLDYDQKYRELPYITVMRDDLSA